MASTKKRQRKAHHSARRRTGTTLSIPLFPVVVLFAGVMTLIITILAQGGQLMASIVAGAAV